MQKRTEKPQRRPCRESEQSRLSTAKKDELAWHRRLIQAELRGIESGFITAERRNP